MAVRLNVSTLQFCAVTAGRLNDRTIGGSGPKVCCHKGARTAQRLLAISVQ